MKGIVVTNPAAGTAGMKLVERPEPPPSTMNAITFLCLARLMLGERQPSTRPAAGPELRVTGAFFALSVPDIDASAKWYQDALDVAVVMRTPKQNGAAAIVLEGGGLVVELIQQDGSIGANPGKTEANPMLTQGLVKAGAIVSDFDRLIARLRERHVAIVFGPYPARSGQRANAIVRDNAGNMLQFFGAAQPPPAER